MVKPYGQLARHFNAMAVALVLAAMPASAGDGTVTLLAFGDSLTAGYDLPPADAFPAQLERALNGQSVAVEVINAGVSGDTAAGGLARLDWTLAEAPDAVILALGANDALRGIDPDVTQTNLDAILSRIAARNIPVLLVGMRAPPNLGKEYGEAFDGLYTQLAERHGVPLYPFFLDGVAARPALNLADGMHPNADGVAVIVERIAPYVIRLIDGVERP